MLTFVVFLVLVNNNGWKNYVIILGFIMYFLSYKEFENITLGTNRGSIPSETAAGDQTDADMREALAQRCHELDTQVRFTFIFF